MRTILIGDTHGHKTWKEIVNKELFDRIVFIGDYFDSFTINTEDQVNNFLDIIEYKKTSNKEVVLLIGNHDLHYITGENGTSGYQRIGKYQIEPIIEANKKYLQMAYQFDNILCTHAGVSEEWLKKHIPETDDAFLHIADQINDLWKYKPDAFLFDGWNSYGDDIGQTPVWIRPISLMRDSKNIKKQGIIQVVGHTHQEKIDILGKSTGGKYFFIDTLPKEYLIHRDGNFYLGTLKKPS